MSTVIIKNQRGGLYGPFHTNDRPPEGTAAEVKRRIERRQFNDALALVMRDVRATTRDQLITAGPRPSRTDMGNVYLGDPGEPTRVSSVPEGEMDDETVEQLWREFMAYVGSRKGVEAGRAASTQDKRAVLRSMQNIRRTTDQLATMNANNRASAQAPTSDSPVARMNALNRDFWASRM
jgi:hypothetical protein